jgi:sec-independent protein translocase protein TatA
MGFVNVGPMELLVLGVIALIVLGPKRLPEAARSLGKGMREMRQALRDDSDEEREPGEAAPRPD